MAFFKSVRQAQVAYFQGHDEPARAQICLQNPTLQLYFWLIKFMIVFNQAYLRHLLMLPLILLHLNNFPSHILLCLHHIICLRPAKYFTYGFYQILVRISKYVHCVKKHQGNKKCQAKIAVNCIFVSSRFKVSFLIVLWTFESVSFLNQQFYPRTNKSILC